MAITGRRIYSAKSRTPTTVAIKAEKMPSRMMVPILDLSSSVSASAWRKPE